MIVVIETGLMTPPLGMSVFETKSFAYNIPLTRIFKGAAPFVGADLVTLAFLVVFRRSFYGCRRRCGEYRGLVGWRMEGPQTNLENPSISRLSASLEPLTCKPYRGIQQLI